MQKAINAIRPMPEKIHMKREVLISLFIMLLGLALGYTAKITDSISLFGGIGTDLGIWVFIVSLIKLMVLIRPRLQSRNKAIRRR